MQVAEWLTTRPEVSRVLYPALPTDPGHAIWARDFSGASGLFGVLLNPAPKAAVDAMLNSLALFGMGASFGGFESLAIPMTSTRLRQLTQTTGESPYIRLHVGLEDPADLIADLEQGFEKLRSVAAGAR
jgi:cystathionine beta-lyase